ncbi:MAG: hypothetical protein V1755_07770 [Chloroflexota bacterium]
MRNPSTRLFSVAFLTVALLTSCAPSTSAPLPTPTPLPGEINNPAVLGLGAEFVPICRQCLNKVFPSDLAYAAGMKELRNSQYPDGLIPWFRFQIKKFFAFANGDNTRFVEGNTVFLTDPKDQAVFDDLFIAKFYANWNQSVQQWTPDAAEIKDVTVGDKSVGATAELTVDGFAWRLSAVSFRAGDVGAFVFTLYPAAADAPGDIVKIARMYADSIKQ